MTVFMSATLNHLLQWFAQNTDSFWNQTSAFPHEWVIESFSQPVNSYTYSFREKIIAFLKKSTFLKCFYWKSKNRQWLTTLCLKVYSNMLIWMSYHIRANNQNNSLWPDSFFMSDDKSSLKGSQSIRLCVHIASHMSITQTLVYTWNETRTWISYTKKMQIQSENFVLFQKTTTWHCRRGFGLLMELCRGALATKETTNCCLPQISCVSAFSAFLTIRVLVTSPGSYERVTPTVSGVFLARWHLTEGDTVLSLQASRAYEVSQEEVLWLATEVNPLMTYNPTRGVSGTLPPLLSDHIFNQVTGVCTHVCARSVFRARVNYPSVRFEKDVPTSPWLYFAFLLLNLKQQIVNHLHLISELFPHEEKNSPEEVRETGCYSLSSAGNLSQHQRDMWCIYNLLGICLLTVIKVTSIFFFFQGSKAKFGMGMGRGWEPWQMVVARWHSVGLVSLRSELFGVCFDDGFCGGFDRPLCQRSHLSAMRCIPATLRRQDIDHSLCLRNFLTLFQSLVWVNLSAQLHTWVGKLTGNHIHSVSQAVGRNHSLCALF